MQYLVTGATGFIGSRLCLKLAGEGHSVRALVRDTRKTDELKAHGVSIAKGDLGDKNSLLAAAAGVDTLFHFAAVFRKEVSRNEIWDVNVNGVERLLEAAVSRGVSRFVHCSSTSVYGLSPKTPTTEESPFTAIPADLYQSSKLGAEQHVRRFGAEGKINASIFRTTGVYGPGDMRFLKLFKPIARRYFVMLGRGEVPFSMIYIDDLLNGILLCANRTEPRNSHYLLTGNTPISLNETARTIARAAGVPAPRWHVPVMPIYFAAWLMESILRPMGISPPLHRRRVNFFRITRGFDNSKAKQELGFDPKIDLLRGAGLTLDWYRSKGVL